LKDLHLYENVTWKNAPSEEYFAKIRAKLDKEEKERDEEEKKRAIMIEEYKKKKAT